MCFAGAKPGSRRVAVSVGGAAGPLAKQVAGDFHQPTTKPRSAVQQPYSPTSTGLGIGETRSLDCLPVHGMMEPVTPHTVYATRAFLHGGNIIGSLRTGGIMM